MHDPDVPKLRETLKTLQDGVREGSFTQELANEVLGKVADALVANREKRERGVRHGAN